MSAPSAPRKPKAAWPLVTLAAFSFVPFLGFFIAAIALTWALLSSRPRARLAIVLSSVGALASAAEISALAIIGTRSGELKKQMIVSYRAELHEVVIALEAYHARTGNYPERLEALTRVSIRARLLPVIDRTGSIFSQRQYQYRLRDDGTYDLFGVGLDGKPDTKDDVRLLPSDSLLLASGYRPPGATAPADTGVVH